MVELIVVIAIMALLVGILAPQFIKYVAKARSSTCTTNIDTLRSEYAVDFASQDEHDLNKAKTTLTKIMTDHGGSAAPATASTLYNGGSFTGICRDGGTLNCSFSDDFTTVNIDCSEHGSLEIDIVTLAEKMQSLQLNTKTYQTIDQYFSTSRTSIDPTATSTNPTAYKPYSSLAEAVTAALNNNGIDVRNRSWRLFKNSSQYNLFLTSRTITMNDVDERVACTKYDMVNNAVTIGTIKVTTTTVNKSTYPILDGGSFQAD